MRLTTFLTALAATAAFVLISPRPARAAEWVELAKYKVEYKTEKEVIEVGKSEGKFTKMRIEAKDGNLIMDKIKVTFANGETFEPETQVEFKEGERSREIDLPGKARSIKKIEFVCKSERKRDPATLVVSGKEK